MSITQKCIIFLKKKNHVFHAFFKSEIQNDRQFTILIVSKPSAERFSVQTKFRAYFFVTEKAIKGEKSSSQEQK